MELLTMLAHRGRGRAIHNLVCLVLTIVGIQCSSTCALGEVIRTYRFIPDGSLPYFASCGECAPPVIGARAEIEGTFTVAFDQQAGTGTLLALDDRLVNTFHMLSTPTGIALEPIDGSEHGVTNIIPAWSSNLQPPIDGVLTSADETLELVSDGASYNLDETLNSIGTSYSIEMKGDRASFSMVVPIDDWAVAVMNAGAIQTVPEPSAIWILFSALLVVARRSPAFARSTHEFCRTSTFKAPASAHQT